jgi:hypothetical protein
MATQARRISGTETAIAASAVVGPLQTLLRTSFPQVASNPVVKAGLPLAPLLFLRPTERKGGLGSVVGDPRLWAAAVVTGIVVLGKNRDVQGAL